MQGKYATFTAPAAGSFQAKYMLYDTMGFYAQDDYRVLPRLTLNLGLRWEFNTQPTEKHGRQSYLPDVPYVDTPVSGTIVGDPSYHDFSPRIGFAWDVFGDGKTSVRGGFAILYDIANLGMEFIQAGIAEPPSPMHTQSQYDGRCLDIAAARSEYIAEFVATGHQP